MLEYIRNELLGLSDKGNYAAFTSALIPGCDNVIGVRQPVLKKYARQLVKDNEDFRALLTEPDIYHEETLLRKKYNNFVIYAAKMFLLDKHTLI